MVSQYPVEDDSDGDFDVIPRPGGDGIGTSMNERLEMREIKPMPREEVGNKELRIRLHY